MKCLVNSFAYNTIGLEDEMTLIGLPYIHQRSIYVTVNHEYFVVKIFSDSLAYVKLNAQNIRAIIMIMRYRIIYLKLSQEIFRHEIFTSNNTFPKFLDQPLQIFYL